MPHLKPGEKAVFVAATGNGKSYLMRQLLKGLPSVIVVDAKHEWSWSEKGRSQYDRIFSSVPDLARNWDGKNPVIYRPDITDLQNGCNEFFEQCWRWRSPLVAIDEIFDLCPRGRAEYWLSKCVKQGRSRGLTIWFGMQRPAFVPLELLSESKHFFVGGLQLPQDRKRMAQVANVELLNLELPPYDFRYCSTIDRTLQPINANDIVKGKLV